MIIEARDDTITLRGTIKANIWPAIQAAAALLLRHHPTGIIIDCSAVTEATAKGAETFADAFKYITACKARIIVAALSPELLEISKVVPGVRSQLPIANTVEEARASIALEEITPLRGKARRTAVVPLFGNWQRAVHLAVKAAHEISAEIHMVDLIKVPRTLPIGSPLPERESAARSRLDAAKAYADSMGIKSFVHAERVRTESAGLIDFMDQLDASFAVVSTDRMGRDEPYIEDEEAVTLIETATRDIAVIKGSPVEWTDPERKQVVLPAVGAWQRGLEFTCEMLKNEESSITVPYLITIPRAEPIDAVKPDIEAASSDAAKEASRIGREYGIDVKPTAERVRQPVLGFMKLFESGNLNMAVVAVRRETEESYTTAREIALKLMQELPCEVVFMKVAP